MPFALAADRVYAREDVVLNPYYRHMGGLYGSEYWTYLLPRRVGAKMTARLTGPPFTPVGTAQAVQIGLLDAAFGATAARLPGPDPFASHGDWPQTRAWATGSTRSAAGGPATNGSKPLQAYRVEEMARAYECFFGPDRSYHEARRRFTRKLGAAETTSAHASPRLAA